MKYKVNMKNFYLVIFFTLISTLLTNILLAQCDDVTLESLTNPGPFEVETLTPRPYKAYKLKIETSKVLSNNS